MNQPIRRLSMLVALMFALLLGSSTWIQVLGGVLIVAGVVLTSRRPGAAPRTPPVPARSPD
mgnify:CR=1 FL=1